MFKNDVDFLTRGTSSPGFTFLDKRHADKFLILLSKNHY